MTNAETAVQTIIDNGLTPCFEIDGEAVYYIEARDNKLVAGTACNVGLLQCCSIDYDNDFSIDENLQEMIETAQEWHFDNA